MKKFLIMHLASAVLTLLVVILLAGLLPPFFATPVKWVGAFLIISVLITGKFNPLSKD